MEDIRQRLYGKLELATDAGPFLDDKRIRLLEAIDAHGSISQAARMIPMSYKAAWDAVDLMNNLGDDPLVMRAAGGRQGGGTVLTPYGRQVIALFRALESRYQASLDQIHTSMADRETLDLKQFQQLFRRMAMKTSARNQFAGTVVALRAGEVDFEVRLRLDADSEIVAVITRESAENLGLGIGTEVHALVKSSSIVLFTDEAVRTTARNQLWGEVVRIYDSPVNCEVTLALSGGKNLCAVITHDSLEKLALETGRRVCAAFKASSVILCVYS